MSDYDTAVREALENLDTWLSDSPDDETRAATKVTRQALAALARLVSERDEWKKLALASQVEISVLRPRVDSTEAEVVSMTQSVQVIQNDRAKLEAEVARLTQGIGMLDDEAESLGREADRLREALAELIQSHDALDEATVSFEVQNAHVNRFEAAMTAGRALAPKEDAP